MNAAALEFLKKILESPSPSGYERPVQEIVRQYVADFADRVTTDSHGNVIAVKNPQGAMRVMLAGHADQIGLLVQYIDGEGYLYCQPIGGWDPMQLIGQRMTVWTAAGALPGVIARKPIHLLTDEEPQAGAAGRISGSTSARKTRPRRKGWCASAIRSRFNSVFKYRNNLPIRRRWTTSAAYGW